MIRDPRQTPPRVRPRRKRSRADILGLGNPDLLLAGFGDDFADCIFKIVFVKMTRTFLNELS